MTERVLAGVISEIDRLRTNAKGAEPEIWAIELLALCMQDATIALLASRDKYNPGTGLTPTEAESASAHLNQTIGALTSLDISS